jgi:hypothetical protein
MNQVESVIEAVVSLFIIFIFAAIVFPALGQATGSNTLLITIALIIMAIGVIASIFKGR